MRELNLLEKSHPKTTQRKIEPGWRTEHHKKVAKKYGKDFFDGDRAYGYGGYYYDGRWKKVVTEMQKAYEIDSNSSVLDIGCTKGFLLYDLQDIIPGIGVAGLDISMYALGHAMDGSANFWEKEGASKTDAKKLEEKARNRILPFMIEGSADNLPWQDNSFDVVLAINTIHNLPEPSCRQAIREMLRVGRDPKKMFIEVDAYHNEEEHKRMEQWVLTAETMLSVEDWLKLFKEEGYKGDYYWFTA